MTSLLLKGGTVVTQRGQAGMDVLIESGVIKEMKGQIPGSAAREVIDAAKLLILPGLIDCHVHFREPGLTHKGTMASEAKSARAGGVTTVCEMPNTSPACVTVAAFAEKVRLAKNVRDADIRFFFGITEKTHLAELKSLMTDPANAAIKTRCCGVKLYLDHSTGDQKVEGAIVDDVFKACAEFDLTLVAHCEDADMNQAASVELRVSRDIADHSRMRPPESEATSVAFAIGRAKTFGTRFHVAHLSTSGALAHVRMAKQDGLNVTCEVAPHHLFLSTDDYPRLGVFGKMNPPLREMSHVQALWDGIRDGTVDCVSTDHAPHTFDEKSVENPLKAPSGVPGVETMLPLLLTAISPEEVVRLCFVNPNRIFGLGKRGIVQGAPADLVVVDPAAEWSIEAKQLHAKCGWTPFEGMPVTGKVMKVITA